MAWVRKRGIMVHWLCCCIALLWPLNAAAANQNLSFDILSFGPLSLEVDLLSFRRKAGFLGLLGSSLSGSVFRTFFPENPPTLPTVQGSQIARKAPLIPQRALQGTTSSPPSPLFRFIIHPEKYYPRLALCAKFNDVIHSWRLELPGSAFMELREDGRMVFRNSPFRGHAFLHYNRCISIWDPDGNIVCVVTGDRGNLLVIQENSSRAALAVKVLFGGPA